MKGAIIYKMSGSGNDFVFVDGRSSPLEHWPPEQIAVVCARRTGVGADGLVVLEPGSRPDAVRFHFFNSDGGRASMCGNAALCAARLAAWLELVPPDGMLLETDVGPLEARCVPGDEERAEIALPPVEPATVPDIAPAPGERAIRLTRVGVPHLVVLVDGVGAVRLLDRGRELRFHPALGPEGANVNFVALQDGRWAMRTYERGVEAETLACGTGAAACVAALGGPPSITLPWDVRAASGTTLTVSGRFSGGQLLDPRLIGEARLVFRAVLGG